MISLERRTIKKGGCTPARSVSRQNYPSPPIPIGGMERLIHCNL
jgi:hypothetical protein